MLVIGWKTRNAPIRRNFGIAVWFIHQEAGLLLREADDDMESLMIGIIAELLREEKKKGEFMRRPLYREGGHRKACFHEDHKVSPDHDYVRKQERAEGILRYLKMRDIFVESA